MWFILQNEEMLLMKWLGMLAFISVVICLTDWTTDTKILKGSKITWGQLEKSIL